MCTQPSAEIVRVECAKCRRECDLSCTRATLCGDPARNAGEGAICPVCAQPSAEIVRVECARCRSATCPMCTQPSAEIVRVECAKCRRVRFVLHAGNTLRRSCAKCRRGCDLSGVRAALCGDRACRVREMQARVRLVRCARNPLRRSCVSSARNAGESAICPVCAQPSAENVRVECAKCRRECDLAGVRATLCGDRACRVREMQARVRLGRCARNPACKRECDLAGVRATLCGDRACRAREM